MNSYATAQTCTNDQKADVLFLVDESGATNNDKIFRTTLSSLVDKFANRLRFGLMTFNRQGYLREAIANNNTTAIKQKINQIKGTGPAKLRQAFRDATTYWTQHITTDTVQLRPRYIFLLTDGGSNDGSPAPEIAALRQLSVNGKLYDVKTYAIGFGNNITQAELDSWASPGGTTKGFLATDQAGLQKALEDAANQATAEKCDNIDNDCDGQVDEGLTQACTVPSCNASGNQVCKAGVWGPCSATQPSPEVCDGKDNNCSGKIDDIPDLGKPCTDTNRKGLCQAGLWACSGTQKVCQQTTQPTTEVCDNKDNDCDGQVDEQLQQVCYSGPSGTQGRGTCRSGTQVCSAGQWGTCQGQVLPAQDVCDGKDNDCDGQIDEGCSCKSGDTRPCGSSTGECQQGVQTCDLQGQWGACAGAVGPQPEVCDGKDNDCNGKVDDISDLGKPCTDPSRKGICQAGSWSCTNNQKICTQSVQPTQEKCDGLDNDCNGTVDDNLKAPPCNKQSGVCQGSVKRCGGTSGWQSCTASDYSRQNSAYEANETRCDGKDNDCDGQTDENITRVCQTICNKGQEICTAGQWGRCSATQPSPEVCDGLDNDCNGKTDDGNPGGGQVCQVSGQQGECAKGQTTCTNGKLTCKQTYTATTEKCGDGKDNDCDGQVDEKDAGCICKPGTTQSCGASDVGACKKGTQTCTSNSQWGTCVGEVTSTQEVCDGKDNDCNGKVDDISDLGQSCVDAGRKGSCQTGVWACLNSNKVCKQTVTAKPETCNGKDDDCNGKVDDGMSAPACSKQDGVCKGSKKQCGGAKGWLPCTDSDYQNYSNDYQTKESRCDEKDNDCNGQVDEPFSTKGNACSAGQGVCKNTGKLVCKGDKTGVECSVKPNAPSLEVCDGKDNDCNGKTDENLKRSCYSGKAGSAGVGLCRAGTQDCQNAKWTPCQGEVLPQQEKCDNADNNCDGKIDETFSDLGQACAAGKGICRRTGVKVCKSDGSGTECSAAAGTPLAKEICNNGLDDNCDGNTDEGCAPSVCKNGETRDCYSGAAGTAGVGPCKKGKQTCQNQKWSACTGEVAPSNELCDNVDNDCNGKVDDNVQRVCSTVCGKGSETCSAGKWGACSAQKPIPEVCGNKKDDDCNGIVDDGCSTCKAGETRACYTGPAGTENKGVCRAGTITCLGNSKWSTCQGEQKPGKEICDGVDNDCDGSVDNNLSRPCNSACGTGTESCVNGKWGNCTAPQPQKEICDGKDNDCNGKIDDIGCSCKNGEVRSCYTGPANTRNVGACRAGTQICVNGQWPQACQGEVLPTKEVCGDKIDNDCDGKDQACSCKDGDIRACPTPCSKGRQVCQNGKWGDCSDKNPVPFETCNGQDDDCDGQVDENLIRTCKTACGPGVDRCIQGKWSGCLGRQPSPEVCDGLDNDCDGKADNNAKCAGGVACVDGICPRLCRNGECLGSEVCQSGRCYPKQKCSQVKCQTGQVCQGGKCVSACSLVTCQTGLVCWKGQCVPSDCYTLGCPSGKVCQKGVCVKDPCASLQCSKGEACRAGQCEKTCVGVTCPSGKTCVSGGCTDDPCSKVNCKSGEVCVKGTCRADPCLNITCPTGRTCIEGECKDDPCSLVRCPSNLLCVKGQCIDACQNKSCNAGETCLRGKCVPKNCYYLGCASGFVCLKSSCEKDPCASVSCAKGTFCRAGQCVLSCVGVKCQTSEQCKDGICNPDPCKAVSCDQGKTCVEGKCVEDKCKTVTCGKGRVCNPAKGQCEDDPCTGVQCPTGVCKKGQCVNPCRDVKCPSGMVCEGGVCIQNDCYYLGCPGDKVCLKKQCVENPCSKVQCDADQFCRNGVCVKSCVGVSCKENEVCQDGDCKEDKCASVTCSGNEICIEGVCKPNPCSGTLCGPGRVCLPSNGQCVDDPCRTVVCPDKSVCRKGQCFKPDNPLPPNKEEKVVNNDAGPDAAPEGPPEAAGCGCSSGEGPLTGLFFLFALAFLLRRRNSLVLFGDR